MLITRNSMLTGKQHTREIDVRPDLFGLWNALPRETRPSVQDAFPDVSDEDREFLLNGITPEEWAEVFGGERFGAEDAD